MKEPALLFLGILTFVVTGCHVLDYEDTGNQTIARSQLEAFAAALNRYVIDTSNIPTDACGLSSLVANCNALRGWRGPYLLRIPLDPWGFPYKYVVINAASRTVEMSSVGTDRGPGRTHLAHRKAIVLRETLP
jgi:general secretion pathway protein G